MPGDYTKVDAAIEKANAKTHHARVIRHRASLMLRATLPPKPSKTGKPSQQRIALGLKAYPGTVGIAAGKALKLESDIVNGTFDWADWIDTNQYLRCNAIVVRAVRKEWQIGAGKNRSLRTTGHIQLRQNSRYVIFHRSLGDK